MPLEKRGERVVTNYLAARLRENDIVKMLLDGKPTSEIVEYLCPKYNLKKSAAQVLISKCQDEVKAFHQRKADYVVSLHIERYEYLYAKLRELGAHTLAIKALQGKEKMMTMHRGDFRIKVTNTEFEVASSTGISSYEVEKLSLEQQAQLQSLLEKARTKTNVKRQL